MVAISMHKSGGSLTQSSILLTGENMNVGHIRQIIGLTQTTSANYLLLSSLDLSRRNLALRGRESFEKVITMAEYARNEINSIGGYYAYGKELIDGKNVFDFDVTKLCVYTKDIGLTGIEIYDLLRDEYDIQIEFGDIGNIMAYISIGDRLQDIERLLGAPPGIPILAPGELITKDIIDHILYAKEKGCSLQGTADPEVKMLEVLIK